MVLGVRLALAVFPYSSITRLAGLDTLVPTRALLTREALSYRRRVISYTAGVSRCPSGDRPRLVQPLVAHRLLRQVGQPPQLRSEVASQVAGDGLHAHAWL